MSIPMGESATTISLLGWWPSEVRSVKNSRACSCFCFLIFHKCFGEVCFFVFGLGRLGVVWTLEVMDNDGVLLIVEVMLSFPLKGLGHSVCVCLKCVASVLTLLVNLFTFRQSKFADFVFGFLGLTIYFDFFILFQISLFSFSPFCGISFVMNLVLFWDNCKELKLT